MRKENGITMIALLIIIILVGIVIFSGIKYAQKYMANQEVEDIKANMLAIQSIVTHIRNKHTVDEANTPFIGIYLELENNTTGYNITEKFKNALMSIEGANLYILNQDELNSNGIKEITVNQTEFYVVDYNSGEVFYSLGIRGKYKLSEI